MKTRPDDPRSRLTSDVTIDYSPPSSLPPAPPGRCVGIVKSCDQKLSKVTLSILRHRLQAASLILLLAFTLFLAWGLLFQEMSFSGEYWALEFFHVIAVGVFAVCAWLLCRRCEHSMRSLRVFELIVFGVPAVFFVFLTHSMMKSFADRDDPYNPPVPWLLLIFTYCTFIPNTWRRAAAVVSIMGLAPLVITAVMIYAHPEVAKFWGVKEFTYLTLTMTVTAFAAVYGTSIIGTLRREAFEARQMGQYRLKEPLGSGGMGEVYLAEHQLLKRRCAIKLIHPEKAGDPRILARFEREVRATAGLSHWNTVEIYDFGRTDQGQFYYVMEYLPGLSLDDLVEQYGPMPPDRVIHLLRQTCQALREAHQAGLIHRDIKPSNIFAAQRGGYYDVAKLLDFGLVKPAEEDQAGRLTHDGSVSGTPWYMSPEQAMGEERLDARSDLYSLGATAYFLLTGRAPFEDENPRRVMIAHARDPVVPPSQHRPTVPKDLEQVVLTCLAKKPEERFPDAEGLEQALTSCRGAGAWTQELAQRWWREVCTVEEAHRPPSSETNETVSPFAAPT